MAYFVIRDGTVVLPTLTRKATIALNTCQQSTDLYSDKNSKEKNIRRRHNMYIFFFYHTSVLNNSFLMLSYHSSNYCHKGIVYRRTSIGFTCPISIIVLFCFWALTAIILAWLCLGFDFINWLKGCHLKIHWFYYALDKLCRWRLSRWDFSFLTRNINTVG